MPLQLKLIHKLTYKLKLTPQMKLSMNLLQLPLVKLKEFIKERIEENPLLNNIEMEDDKKPVVDSNYNLDDEEKKNYRESLITKPPTLTEHLLRQLHLLTNSEYECKIGDLIIENINENGYLECSIEDIAETIKTTNSKVEKVLAIIQTFDPIGIGARDPRECLLLQLKARGDQSSLAYQIVDKYLPYLEKKRFDYIAKKIKIPIEKIKQGLREIAHLEPKPGRSFNTETAVRLIPDAILRKDNDRYEIILNDWELPSITLNDKYKSMIKQKDAPEDAKEYLRERLRAARELISAVNKRKQTIQDVIREIVYIQKEFFDKGVANFKPMTLEQIAKRIGKHKSTVCRAVTSKYLQTPQGIFELRYFLSSGIKQEGGSFISSKAIKSKIKELIERENKENPLTDQKIAEHLKQEGISASRRTIAKYRTQLKTLASPSRRQ